MIEALGRYELLRMLGRGGMAEVYLARRRVAGLEKRLVVKRIRRERAGDPAVLDLFMREAQLSMSLGHQNVVPVFDFGRVGDDAFLAMELVDGRDLAATIARADRPVPPLLAAYIASECCRALDHAHHRRAPDGSPAGVIHRDVTPRNVLLSWAGEVKLADFGVATLAGGGDDRVRGTWAYMAPEQARGESIDGRADLYALGLVLWAMVAGARPRTSDDAAALCALACSGELPEPPAVAPALRGVVERATARDREGRFADAREMQEALDHYLIAARAETPGPPPERQLAAWMAEVWGEDERHAELGVDAGGEVLTVDRTQRSTAATVADDEPGPPPAAFDADARAAETSDGARGVIDARAPVPSVPGRRSMLRFNLLAGAAAAAIVVLLVRTCAGGDGERAVRRGGADEAAARGAAPTTAPPVGSTTTSPPPATSNPPVATGPAEVTPTPPTRRASAPVATRRRAPSTAADEPAAPSPSPSAAIAPASAAPAPRKVTIGATPWADFTIDDDPTPYQTPETVVLRPGPHRIHLRNPTLGVERTIVLDVPADRDLRHLERLDAR
jgi:serine/threonine-protein kinase